MAKFNEGDRVVALRDDLDITKGKTYEVLEINNGWEFPVVLRDDVGDRNAMREIDLELAEEYEDETVKQLQMEIADVKTELGVLAGQVARLGVGNGDPKPEFKAGDVVRFKATYVDFEGEVAKDGEYGEIIHNLFNPVVLTDSGTEVLIDTDEVDVTDVIEHVDISERSNESETKDSKTVVVEYDPIDESEIKAGDVLLCREGRGALTHGRVYEVRRVIGGDYEIVDDEGYYSYIERLIGYDAEMIPLRQRITG